MNRNPEDGSGAPGGGPLSDLYRSASRETPPSALDAEILAHAEAPVTSRRRARRWAVPLSLAATVVIAVGVGLRIMDERGSDPAELMLAREAEAPRESSAQTAPKAAEERVAAPAAEPPAVADAARARTAVGENEAKVAAKERQDRYAAARMEESAQKGEAASALVAPAATQAEALPAVLAVRVTGGPGAYEFQVTVRSPDTGCDRYADWWEVVSEDGRLLYRRVLAHSHVDEQPFTRSGGPVPIGADTVVWVRAHLNTGGYGRALRGSPARGFAAAVPPAGFAAGVETEGPKPSGCDF